MASACRLLAGVSAHRAKGTKQRARRDTMSQRCCECVGGEQRMCPTGGCEQASYLLQLAPRLALVALESCPSDAKQTELHWSPTSVLVDNALAKCDIH